MKAYIFISTCFLYILLAASSNAQCPTGWNYVSKPYGPDPSGCTWQIEICYKCGVTGANPSNIKVIDITPAGDEGCLAPDKDWLINQLINDYWSYCTIPPCDEGCQDIVIESPLCYQCHTIGNYYEGEYHYYSWYAPCLGSGYCQVTNKICKDYQTGDIVECGVRTYQTFNLNCPDDPQPPCPTEIEEDFEGEQVTGPCFQLNNCFHE